MRTYRFMCTDDVLPLLRYAPGHVTVTKAFETMHWTVLVSVDYESGHASDPPIDVVPTIVKNVTTGGQVWDFRYTETKPPLIGFPNENEGGQS